MRWVNFLNSQTDDDVYVHYVWVAGSRSAEAWIKDGNRVGDYYRHSRNDVPLICSRGSPKTLVAIVRLRHLRLCQIEFESCPKCPRQIGFSSLFSLLRTGDYFFMEIIKFTGKCQFISFRATTDPLF